MTVPYANGWTCTGCGMWVSGYLTGGHICIGPIAPVAPAVGWVCPKCGAGNAPSSMRCACVPSVASSTPALCVCGHPDTHHVKCTVVTGWWGCVACDTADARCEFFTAAAPSSSVVKDVSSDDLPRSTLGIEGTTNG